MSADERRLACIMGLTAASREDHAAHTTTTAPRVSAAPDFSKLFSNVDRLRDG